MTLAAILAVFCLALGWSPASSPKSAATQSQAAASSPQTQTPSQTPPPASAQPASNPATQGATKPPQRRHKKPPQEDCASSAAIGTNSATQKPCPLRKTIVRNGGTAEPTVELKGKTSAEQASNQRSTEQLTAATEDNLSKIAGQTLTPSQRELVNQIHQFMEQSKNAVAAGDPDRGHNLAIKAHLLSDELVKP
jgi:hypothetical protein